MSYALKESTMRYLIEKDLPSALSAVMRAWRFDGLALLAPSAMPDSGRPFRATKMPFIILILV
jgi:hypothetical protein